MIRTGICAIFKLADFDRDTLELVSKAVMRGMYSHLVLEDPHVGTDAAKGEMEVEFVFDCPADEDQKEKGRMYAELVVRQACAEVGVGSGRIVYQSLTKRAA